MFPLKWARAERPLVLFLPRKSLRQQKHSFPWNWTRKKIQLSNPIRNLGVTIVPVKLQPKVTAELKVHVTEA